MNKIIFSLALFLSHIATYSQSQTSKRDFNKDGAIDYVTVKEDGGSSFSSKFISYYDGKTKKTYKFDIDYSFGSFFSTCKIPSVLGKVGRETMGNFLFGTKDTIEPSLNWLIDATSSNGTKYKPIWISREPQIPNSYYTIIEGKKYMDFLKSFVDSTVLNSKSAKPDYYWIDYNTGGHAFERGSRSGRRDSTIIDGFKITKIDSSTWLYNTANAVILKKGDKYSWVFISDSYAGTGQQKLRWKSIEDVNMFKGFVLVSHSYFPGGSGFLVIINPITGDILSLNEDYGFGAIERLKVNGDSVELDTLGEYVLTESKINQLFKKVSRNQNY